MLGEVFGPQLHLTSSVFFLLEQILYMFQYCNMAVQDGSTGKPMSLSFVMIHTVSDMKLQRLHLRFNVAWPPYF